MVSIGSIEFLRRCSSQTLSDQEKKKTIKEVCVCVTMPA